MVSKYSLLFSVRFRPLSPAAPVKLEVPVKALAAQNKAKTTVEKASVLAAVKK